MLDEMSTYNDIFFEPFGPSSQAAPTFGFRQVSLGWVPIPRDDKGDPCSPAVLRHKLAKCAALRNFPILAEPRWIVGKDRLVGCNHSNVVFAFFDPTGKGFELLKRCSLGMFGRLITVNAFESHPLLSQCTHCWRLGHPVERCRRSTDLILCSICGGSHHSSHHLHSCPFAKSHHKGAPCNCLPTCFLCVTKHKPGKGHTATNHTCPLCKSFHSPPPSLSVPQPQSEGSTTDPPTPAADSPFTLHSEHSDPVLTIPSSPRSAPPLTQATAKALFLNEVMMLSSVSVENRMAAMSLVSRTDLSLSDLGARLIQLTGPSRHLNNYLQTCHTTAPLTTSQIEDVL